MEEPNSNWRPRRNSLNLSMIAGLRRNSLSRRSSRESAGDSGELYSPRSPDGLPKPPAPRSGAFSARSMRRPMKSISMTQHQLSEIIEDIKSQDYSRLRLTKPLLDEQRRIMTTGKYALESDRAFESDEPVDLLRGMLNAMNKIDDDLPEYFNSTGIEDIDVCKEELSHWFYVMSECIIQVATYSESLALVLDAMKSRFMELFRMSLDQIRTYQETIQTQDPVVLDAIDCENTVDAPFRKDLFLLEVAVKNSNIGTTDRDSLLRSLKRIEETVNKKIAEEGEVGRLRRENESFKQRNKELSMSNFDIQSRKHVDDMRISDLMDVTNMLRRTIAEKEQKIYALTHASGTASVGQGMGNVPPEALKIWDQMSHFCKWILEGGLMKLDLSSYCPKEANEKFCAPYFTLKKPEARQDPIHFVSFFSEMKKTFEAEGLFNSLETQMRQFLVAFSNKALENFIAFKKENDAIREESIKKLDEMRKSSGDSSAILSAFTSRKEFLQIPKKAKPIDVHISMASVYRHSVVNAMQRSVADTVISSFGLGNTELVPFIAQIARLSKNDPDVDLFRRFLTRELPFHQFLFYAHVCCRLAESKQSDPRPRKAVLFDIFGPYGWNGIPKIKKASIENGYVQNANKFPILCLALYAHCIEGITIEIQGKCGSNSIETTAGRMLEITGQELFEASEYMKAVAEGPRVTPRELAILLFKRKSAYPSVLVDFAPENSKTIAEYENFNVKKPKARRASCDRTGKPPPLPLPSLH